MERLTDDVMALICELAIPAGHYVGFRREDAKRLIARIGKAYESGELMLTKIPPKLPTIGSSIYPEGWTLNEKMVSRKGVLSILDKWELVAEYDAPVDVGLHIIGKCDNYADVGLSLDFEEGDHIAIYKRRGKEDRKA